MNKSFLKSRSSEIKKVPKYWPVEQDKHLKEIAISFITKSLWIWKIQLSNVKHPNMFHLMLVFFKHMKF